MVVRMNVSGTFRVFAERVVERNGANGTDK
jgi:hypothetical protein